MNTSRKWIMIVCLVLIIALEVYLFKIDWNPIISVFSILITVTILICFVYKQMNRSCELLFEGGAGNGCCETLFSVNGTQWRLPHIENVSFDDALRYEDNEWRLATLKDFSVLNKCAKYETKRNKRTINICIDEFSFYLEPRYWTGNVKVEGKNRVVAAAQYYPTGFQPFHGHLPDMIIGEKAGVILVKKDPIKTYIEVQIKGDDIDIWNLKPEVSEKFRPGDKIAIERSRITEPDFMLGIFFDDTRNIFLQNENHYFGSSNMLFVQIIEKIYHENHIEFHGKIVTEDGLFYSSK